MKDEFAMLRAFLVSIWSRAFFWRKKEEFAQEVRFYQQAIVEALAHTDPRFGWETEVPELAAHFNALATQDDLTHFYR